MPRVWPYQDKKTKKKKKERKTLILVTLTTEKEVMSFHLTFPVLSTQYTSTQEVQQFPAESSVKSAFEILQKSFYRILLNLNLLFCWSNHLEVEITV